VECLEAALWCFATTDDFESAILKAVNLGDDADTTAAICGQISGAFYGYEGLPLDWLEHLAQSLLIEDVAIQMTKRSAC
jgi:ADP-ribosyl-[dinitrogen reductase] hydrolase